MEKSEHASEEARNNKFLGFPLKIKLQKSLTTWIATAKIVFRCLILKIIAEKSF